MKKLASKLLPCLVAFILLIGCCSLPTYAAGRYFNTGVVPASEWQLSTFVFSPDTSTSLVDMGSYYEFSITGLSLGDTAYFGLDMYVGNLAVYDTETLHGLINLDIYAGAGGYQLSRSRVMLYDTTTLETNGPSFDAIGVSPEGSLPSLQLVHMQIAFDMSTNFSFDHMQLQFKYTKSRNFDDVIRIYKTSTFQLYTGDLDSEILSEIVTEQQITNSYLEEITGDNYDNPSDGVLGNTVGDLTSKEEQLTGSLNVDGTVDLFKSFELSDFHDGLLCMVDLFDMMMPGNAWYFSLIQLSLALGLFAFIVGVSSIAVRVASSRSRRDNYSKSYDAGYRKGRGDSLSSRRRK